MNEHEQPSKLDVIRYYVDLFLSRSPYTRFLGLFLISSILILFCSILIIVVSPSEADTSKDFLEAVWWATMRVIDAGNMAGDSGTLVRFVAALATLSGIMVVALLIGLVSSTVGDKIEDLRRGKGPVIDSNHTLLIGFSDKAFTIIRELITANENQKSASVVILSEQDKTEVEDELRERIPDTGTTRIVVRQGSAFSPADLKKVGAGRAKSIIVLAADLSGEDGASSDLNAIKTILALHRVPGALKDNHAVVELEDIDQAAVVSRLGKVEVVAMRDTLARLMVQTARQSGLASVYRNILNFDGAEFYFKAFPEVTGRTFAQAQTMMRGATLIGLRSLENGQPKVGLNPGPETIIREGEELIVLAEDDDSFSVAPEPGKQHQSPETPVFTPPESQHERILICGYRSDLDRVIAYFDSYVKPGAEIHLMPGKPFDAVEVQTGIINARLKHLHRDPAKLQDVREVFAEGYHSVLLVADDTIPVSETDARTVISLLLLREAMTQTGKEKHATRIVSEILDPRTKDLVSADQSTDFVVSSEITSMLLAQVSEQRDLNLFYQELFDPDGSEIYLKSVERYIRLTGQSQIPWRTVQTVAGRYGEIAIGCYRAGNAPFMNPAPDQMLTFAPGDKIVVIAEDESEATEQKMVA
jgi:Trk K+ transport system NAD-binding subunit